MKQLFLSLALCLTVMMAAAQDFSGYRAGNYTGVNGAFFNPASIADSRYRFDLNLISASTSVGNNKASFNLKDLLKSFDTDKLEDQLIGQNAGPSSAIVSANIHGPSLMFSTGRKMAFALTTRARVMTNITDLDGKLADKLINDFNGTDPSLPYSIASSSNMRVNVNAWTEFGLTIGRVLRDNDLHFLKTGASLKYLAGAGNGYVNLGSIQATINEDAAGEPYLVNTTGRIAMGFGGINLSDLEAEDLLEMKSTGFGADIGFVYEYRPNAEKHELGETGTLRRDVNKYKFKVGLALLDIGSLKYKRDPQRSGGYNININGTDTLHFAEFDDEDLDTYKSFFDSKPQYFTPDGNNNSTDYKVGLPTTLQVNVDYHLHRGFYIDLAAQVALSKSDSKLYNSSYYSGVTLTPRYEGRKIGLYVPVNYNGLTKFNAGAALRVGSLFVGSGSVFTALWGNSKQADAYVGLRIGMLQKKAGKVLHKMEKKRVKREKRAAKEAEKAANKMEAPQQN
jgi:hypothetical protein